MSRSISIAILLCALLAGSALAQKAVPIKTLPFSAARKAGNTLYVSGQIPRTADGKDVRTSVDAETRQVMDNLGRILKANGYTFDDVVFANVYLKDIEDYHEMNKAYASFYKNGIFPARACVGGAQIVFDFKVEISVIAYKEPTGGHDCDEQGCKPGDHDSDEGHEEHGDHD